jgi:hypothetical protein
MAAGKATAPVKMAPIFRGAVFGAAVFASVLVSAQALTAQDNPEPSQSAAYLGSSEAQEERSRDVGIEQQGDPASKVYFPDAITPESVTEARQEVARQHQLASERDPEQEVAQVSATSDGSPELDQLSDGDAAGALAQLTEAERQVLLEAVEGTDICDRETDIEALRELCESRIETRSAEFARGPANTLSAEERLLGEGLDADRVSTLETAIRRLANNTATADDFSNQAIASVALRPALAAPQPTGTEDPAEGAGELSPETQSLIEAIVNQFGGNTGGP